MSRTTLFVLSLLVSFFAAAQNKEITTLSFDNLYHIGINPAGELYAASDNKITRMDKNGSVLNELTLPTASHISQFDSWHLTQFVLYYRETQRVEIYNPVLDLRNAFTIDSVFAIEPEFIAASFDQKHFWIFDKADGSLKKVNYKTGEVLIDEVITIVDTQKNPPVSMREYQRFLFLQTQKKLFVFNAMGKHIHSFDIHAQQQFDFFGEEFFLVGNTELLFTSLFTTEKRSVQINSAFDKVLLTDERLFGIKKNTVEIIEFTLN